MKRDFVAHLRLQSQETSWLEGLLFTGKEETVEAAGGRGEGWSNTGAHLGDSVASTGKQPS